MRACILVLLLAGCAAADSAERWAGTVDTLGNGAIQVTNPATGMWSEGGSGWQLERELELGSADGPEPLIFATVSGIEADADGRIYVLDRAANQLRIFTGAGEHVRTVGREGAGPGEYRNANGLMWLTPDTLLVVDQRGMRYSILDREGTFVRSVPRQLGFYGWMFAGGIARGRIYERTYAESGPKPAMVLVGTSPAGVDTAAARDTVWLPVAQGSVYESFRLENARGTMSMQVPFTSTPVYQLDLAGRIWHGHGSAPRLVRTAIEGDTTMEVLLDATPAPVTDAEIAEWEAGEFVKQFRERAGRIDMDRIPKVKPFFDGLIVDPEGNLWLSIPASPIETGFAIVDSSGRYLGRVHASGFRRNARVPPVVRNSRLYLTGFDELDVPKVYVFRIVK
jgi:hypothetical protein